MASYRNENRPDSGDLLSWIITIVLLVSPVWPIGLILLLRKLTGGSRRRASRPGEGTEVKTGRGGFGVCGSSL